MRQAKVVEFVDIEAPKQKVFDIITHHKLRAQLSPLWGLAEIESLSPDFPQEGSGYHVRLTEEAANGDEETEYDIIVTALTPNQKFAYRYTNSANTQATWTVQDVTAGTRLIYQEEFTIDEAGDDETVHRVRDMAQQWLQNTKQYAELGDALMHRFVKWLLDRYLLNLRVEQRRMILLIIAFKMAMILSLIGVGVGLFIATRLF